MVNIPTYTTINNFQAPQRQDFPNAEQATWPLANGVEKRALLPWTTKAERTALQQFMSNGQISYLEEYDDIQVLHDGLWTSAFPRVIKVEETTIPGTADVLIASFPVEDSSIYKVEGYFYFLSETDAFRVTPDVASMAGGYYRIATNNSTANTNTDIAADADPQLLEVRTLMFWTGLSSDTFEINARKAADAGADAEVMESYLFVSKIGTVE